MAVSVSPVGREVAGLETSLSLCFALLPVHHELSPHPQDGLVC